MNHQTSNFLLDIHQRNPRRSKAISLPNEKVILMGWCKMLRILRQCETDVGIAIHEDWLSENPFDKVPGCFEVDERIVGI